MHKPKKKSIYPSIILLHGFTGYKEEAHIQILASDLARNGFVAIRFDASGFGESEGSLVKDFRFSNYLADIEVIYELLKSKAYVNKNKIGIWGQSMGGMLAIIFAAGNLEIKAICSISSPIKMETTDWLRNFMSEWKRTGWWVKENSRGGKVRIPYAFMEDAQKYNVLDFIGKIHQPIFIILGLKEDTVKSKDTHLIFQKANEPKKLLEIKDMTHDYKNNSKHIKIVDKAVINFFKENL